MPGKMSNCLTPVLYLSFLLVFSVGEFVQVCHHMRDIVNPEWMVQCFELDSTNAYQLKLVLEDAYRIMPHHEILAELSNSDGAAVPAGIFDDYIVKSLIMINCNFTSLPFHVIANMSDDLHVLQLRDNQIDDFDFKRFNQMLFAVNLQYLGLANNKITSMPEDALANFIMVDTLDLRNNLLQELVDNTFRGMVTLKSLYLQNNQIVTIGQNSFAHLQNLYLLVLDENKIGFLEEGTLSMQNQSSLREIPLEGNPFHCNCTLQWLKEYLSSIHYLELSGATCVAPKIAKFGNLDFCAAE